MRSSIEFFNGYKKQIFCEMAEPLTREKITELIENSAVIIWKCNLVNIRKLCAKVGISTEAPDSKGVPRPKKADLLNSELCQYNDVYNKLDLKKCHEPGLIFVIKPSHGQYTE